MFVEEILTVDENGHELDKPFVAKLAMNSSYRGISWHTQINLPTLCVQLYD